MKFNLDAANNLMAKYKLDALLFIDPGSLKYFGYDLFFNSAKDWMLKPGGTNDCGVINFCLVPYKKNPVYIISAFSVSSIDDDILRDCDIVPYGPFINLSQIKNSLPEDKNNSNSKSRVEKNLYGLLSKVIYKDQMEALEYVLAKYNLENSSIAVEQDCISNDLVNNIKNRFSSASFYEGSELIRLIRMVKTPEEVLIIQNCLEITEEALLKAVNSIKPGSAMQDLKEIYRNEAYKRDALYEHFLFSPKAWV